VIVVTNTSPLLNLACIGQQSILESLFGVVQVSPAVSVEIQRLSASNSRFSGIQVPAFARVKCLQNMALATALGLDLDPGEAEAIALAVELRADLLLIDEHRGRAAAKRLGIQCLGLLGALTLAKRRAVVPAVEPLLERLTTEAGFWIAPALRQRILSDAGELS
jgi:uncharacterized protein